MIAGSSRVKRREAYWKTKSLRRLNMKNVAEIAREINSNNLTVNQLNCLMDSIQSMIQSKARASLYVGQEVFIVQKTKRSLGRVEKINSTRCLVLTCQGKFSVPITMLEAA